MKTVIAVNEDLITIKDTGAEAEEIKKLFDRRDVTYIRRRRLWTVTSLKKYMHIPDVRNALAGYKKQHRMFV